MAPETVVDPPEQLAVVAVDLTGGWRSCASNRQECEIAADRRSVDGLYRSRAETGSMRSMLCPYCGLETASEDFTDEHVIPSALGGNLEPTNPFKLRVCGQCNNRCGREVDGPFIRSQFIHMARSSAGRLAVNSPTLQPSYFGYLDSWQGPDVCDFWLGATGAAIFHFHAPYTRKSPAIVGKPIGAKPWSTDPGVAFVIVRSNNPAWFPLLSQSIEAEFKGAPAFYINLSCNGEGPPYPAVPDSLTSKLEWIRSLPPRPSFKFTIDPHCGDRFLAKLALGIGSIVLRPAFVASDHASNLRRYLWSRDADERRALNLRGKSLYDFAGTKELKRVLSWRNCHTIALMPAGENMVLGANFYGDNAMGIVLAVGRDMWEKCAFELGMLWVVCPGLRMCAGPMSLVDFELDARSGTPTGPLAELDRRMNNPPELPPIYLPS